MRSCFTSNANVGTKLRAINHFCRGLAAACVLVAVMSPARGEVPAGSQEKAELYYKGLATKLNYSTPDLIGDTTLTDLAVYLGYSDLTADQMETESPKQLMARGAAGDVLVSRFFAPKIMNVKVKEG